MNTPVCVQKKKAIFSFSHRWLHHSSPADAHGLAPPHTGHLGRHIRFLKPPPSSATPNNRGKPQLGRWAFYWENGRDGDDSITNSRGHVQYTHMLFVYTIKSPHSYSCVVERRACRALAAATSGSSSSMIVTIKIHAHYKHYLAPAVRTRGEGDRRRI
eukprot:scaffold15081_cov123-Isochrysis_galbana.AAC.5